MEVVSRRPGVLGVHSLDHFEFAVPDLAMAQAFYERFGLDVRAAEGGLDLHTYGHPHRWARVVEGPRKALRHISFGAFDDDMTAFRGQLDALGVDLIPSPDPADNLSLWFRDPHGVLLRVRPAEKSSPNAPSPHSPAPTPSLRGAPMRGDVPPVRPRRMSHALFFTPGIDATLDFYSRVLGLRISDHPGPVAFLHGVHGSDHHLIAFAQSSAPGYHHSAWDVGSLEEVGLGAAQMAEAGHTRGWGVGRHVLGSNYFHYVQDPWGSFAEYSFDIDYVPADLDWETGHPAPENSLYLWGPPPPEDFITNHEAAA
ncbi:VOC family protein [Phenylobacterium sp.]|uniref:VOC family protein n=1 Tax=Phenylobacterium sp. TaxID=1871053 RepID=UPI002C8610F9|nr:VOC family protein [Phenylobacterium sp.]HLZ74196.1 VOC family protein [Phenylobacterium sp.]